MAIDTTIDPPVHAAIFHDEGMRKDNVHSTSPAAKAVETQTKIWDSPVYQTVINSYAILFFSQSKLLGWFVLTVSFFNPYTGLAGLVSLIVAVVTGFGLGFGKQQLKTGFYTYSSLLTGLGMGALYELSFAMLLVLALASLLVFMLSAVLIARFARNNLPALSLPFILTLWLVMLASKGFESVGLTERNIFWLNEMYAIGGSRLIKAVEGIEYATISPVVAGFFRSLSAILFQNNLFAGILLCIGIFMYSRLALLMMLLGYAVAISFHYLLYGGSTEVINYYNLGTNFMLTALAIGGIYLIPSPRSFFWAILLVPIAYLLTEGAQRVTLAWGLPVFSLPFCIVVIIFLYTLRLRSGGGKLIATPIQFFNPEVNLYRHLTGKERFESSYYYHLSLPVMGEWMVSQGYNGSVTHKGEWSKAFDFVILDQQMKTYRNPGSSVEDFYCYNKPVLAPADAIVEEIVDNVEDNAIGGNNSQQNWGNTIVLKHAAGLYSQLSHLKKNSFRVQKGAFVRKGDIVGAVGNSGRSPEPHLHYQVQTTPFVGSKTLDYPFSYIEEQKGSVAHLLCFSKPVEGSFVKNIEPSRNLQDAFNFQPGSLLKVSAVSFAPESWEVKTTPYNESYIYCSETGAQAFFINNGTVFYFTAYYGNASTLLHYFFLAAYKVLLTGNTTIIAKDNISQNFLSLHPLKWLQDLVAPFYIFMQAEFESRVSKEEAILGPGKTCLQSTISRRWFSKRTKKMETTIEAVAGKLVSLDVTTPNQKIRAVWEQ